MKNIKESIRKSIKEVEENNAREIHVYKTIKKYFDDFGPDRGAKLLNAITRQLEVNYSAGVAPKDTITPGPVMEMMMGPEDNIEDLGDSLMSSSRLNDILTKTYATDFEDELEYTHQIINSLISEFEGYDFYDELFGYIKDVYSDNFIRLYRSGDDDYSDGDNDDEFFV
jgi:hypothetical protein